MKRKLLIGLILCGLCITGCDSNNTTGSEDNNTSNEDVVTINSVDELYAIEEFSGESDFEYVRDTDCQSDLGVYANTAYTSDGYYTMEYDYDESSPIAYKFLKYYDYATNQQVYVCSKSNCSHKDSECDAYFDDDIFPEASIWYYEGNIYTLMLDKDYLCMCKVSPDGTTRENICTIDRITIDTEIEDDGTTSTSTYYPIIQLHRGYIYCSTYYPGNTSTELYRLKMDNSSEKETICVINNYEPMIYRIKPYGRYVFFQMGYENVDDSENSCPTIICAFDAEEPNGIMKVCDDVLREYTVSNDKLFYCDQKDDVYVKDLKDGTEELFFDLDTETTYTFDFSNIIFYKDDYLVFEITNLSETYDQNTDTYYQDVYQLLINEDGEVEKTLRPDDEKLYPYS